MARAQEFPVRLWINRNGRDATFPTYWWVPAVTVYLNGQTALQFDYSWPRYCYLGNEAADNVLRNITICTALNESTGDPDQNRKTWQTLNRMHLDLICVGTRGIVGLNSYSRVWPSVWLILVSVYTFRAVSEIDRKFRDALQHNLTRICYFFTRRLIGLNSYNHIHTFWYGLLSRQW